MVSFSGSFIATSTTIAATNVRTQMQTTIPSHSNWSLVESTTMNTGAVPCDVYKCSSVGNGLGVDFYVAIMQSSAVLTIGIAEGYNSTTHKPKRPAIHAPVALQTLQADGGLVSSTLEIDWFNGTTNPGGGVCTVFGTSAGSASMYNGALVDDYKIMVGIDCIYFFSRASSTYGYAGAYDSLVPTPGTNDPLPLIVAQGGVGSATSVQIQAMRHPLCGGASIGFATNVNGASSNEASYVMFTNVWAQPGEMGTLGNSVTNDNVDLYAGGLVTTVRRVILLNSFISASATVGRDKNGWMRGFMKHFRAPSATVTGLTWGDQATIDGVTYVFAPTSGWFELNPA